MKVHHRLIFLSSLLTWASCHPLSYQKVKFVFGSNTDAHRQKANSRQFQPLNRNSRSFGHSFSFPSWDEGFGFSSPGLWPSVDEIIFPPPALTVYDLGFERGHITPDYSNGLDFPDPLLLRGKDALHAVKYLYGRGELFYHNIPHLRALLRNQEERKENGLAPHHLSSNRPGSPFFRQ